MEARNNFMSPSASMPQNQMSIVSQKEKIISQSVKIIFADLHEVSKGLEGVEGLQELIYNCINKDKSLQEQHTVNKVNQIKKRTNREM